MPKIPTFTSQARPTAQVGSVKSNLQVPLSQTVAGALSPVTDFVVKKAVQANDTQNRTEALRLGNEFTRELQTVEDYIANDSVLGVNKEAANAYYKEQTNSLISQFKGQSTNSASQTLFENNALSAVNRGIFRIDNTVEKNVFTDLQNQVSEQETFLITQALFNNRDANVVDEFGMAGNVNAFDYATLQTNLTKLYTDAFTGKIPAPKLNEMIGNIPALVQGFQANKDIYDKPSFAYDELKKGQNSSVYPDLNVEQRTKLVRKVETLMVQPLKKEFANVIFSLQDQGTEQAFDFNFAKKILPAEEYNQLKTTYDLAKTNAEDVRLINTLPLIEADELIKNKNFNEDSYTGLADEITQAQLKEGLIKAMNNRVKQMKDDPVGFITKTNSNIAELTNNLNIETGDPQIELSNRKILTNALIDEQLRMKVNSANIKILSKQEVTQIKSQFLDPTITSENKLKLIESLKVNYGNENMGMIVNHLQDEKTPETILMAISTDSVELAKDLFSSSTLVELKKLAQDKGTTTESLKKIVAKKTEDFGQVVDSQGEGSESKAALMLRINEALLKVTLVRMNKNVSAEEAAESAANDFLGDYVVNDSLTWLIPKTINRIPVPVVAAQNKAEAIMIGVKDTSEGNYLDRVMGVDGYMHYASSLNIPNLTEEEVKKRVTFTIRNHSKWLNNSDMTGMVLYADFSNGLQPVRNSEGERIEFYFTEQPNQDPKIKTTDSIYPITGDVLPLIPDPNPFGDIEYDVDFENENLKVSGLSQSEYDKQFIGMKNQVANSNAIMSDASIINTDNNSLDMWNKFYKTETKIVNGNPVQMTQEEIKIQKDKANKRLNNGNYQVPASAKSSIDVATNIFSGQNGMNKEQLTKLLSDIGQIESQYKTKIQYKGGPARSYWQVEAASALDVLKQNAQISNPLFGQAFETQFAKIKRPSGTTVLQYLSTLSNNEMKKQLLNNSDLAATIALGIVLNRQ
jgi:hypothetical protein